MFNKIRMRWLVCFLLLFISKFNYGNVDQFTITLSKVLELKTSDKYQNLTTLIKNNPNQFQDQKVLDLIEKDFVFKLTDEENQIYKTTKLLFEVNRQSEKLGSIHYIFSAYYAFKKELKSAIKHAELSRFYFKKNNNFKGEIRATFSKGVFYCNLSNFAYSNIVYIKLLQNKRLSTIDKGNIHYNIAVNYYNSHFYSESENHLIKASKLLPKSEFVRVYITLGTVYSETKRYDLLKKTIATLSNYKMSKYDTSNYLELKAILLKSEKKASLAITELNKSISLTESMGFDYYLPSRYLIKGEIYEDMNNIDSAIITFQKALLTSEAFQNGFIANESIYHLAKCYSTKGNFKKSSSYFEKYISTKNSLFGQSLIQKMEKNTHILKVNHLKDQVKINSYKRKWLLKQYELKKSELKQSQATRIFVVLISLSLIAFLIILNRYRYRSNKLLYENIIKTQQNEIIQENLKGQEEEKERIALELHDGVANELLTLTFTTDLKIKESVNEILFKIRNLSHDLTINTNNEIISISSMTENLIFRYFQDTKYSIHFGWHPSDIQLIFKNGFHQQNLYRILQEIFSNTNKHSFATVIEVFYSVHDDVLVLTISDNGVGFIYMSTETQNGIGLKNLNKRIEYLSGTISIDSSKNRGATFIIEIPISKFEQLN